MNARGGRGIGGGARAAAARYMTCCMWPSLTSGHLSFIHFDMPAIEYK